MPSPFPGMDPYIEDPFFWSDFHATMMGVMREALNSLLPKKYIAAVERHVWIEPEARAFSGRLPGAGESAAYRLSHGPAYAADSHGVCHLGHWTDGRVAGRALPGACSLHINVRPLSHRRRLVWWLSARGGVHAGGDHRRPLFRSLVSGHRGPGDAGRRCVFLARDGRPSSPSRCAMSRICRVAAEPADGAEGAQHRIA